MKIAVFWKKYNGSNHKEIRRIYSFIFYALSELGYDFDVLDQNYYQNQGAILRASRNLFLPEYSWTRDIVPIKKKWPWSKPSASVSIPNMPFCGRHFLEEYDISIMFHTIGTCKKTTHVKPSYYPGFFYFDAQGYSAWSAYSQNEDFTDISPPKEWLGDLLNKTKYEQTAKGNVSTKRPYIFVPLQVATDSVANLAPQSTAQFLETVVAMAEKMPYDVVIKPHPKCINQSLKQFLKKIDGSNGIYVFDGSVFNLIDNSKAVFVVNSGVGFESLLRSKPVVTFGDSDYAFAACRFHETNSFGEICQYIESFSIKEREQSQTIALQMLSRNFIRIGDVEQFHEALKHRMKCADVS